MSGSSSISGTFRKATGFPWVVWIPCRGGVSSTQDTDYTNGCIAADPLVSSPTGTERWEVSGFSAKVRMAVKIADAPTIVNLQWARFGDVWAGLLKDFPVQGPSPSQPQWPPAIFPPDFSTFTKLWSGDTDPISVLDSNSSLLPANFPELALSTVLNNPITIDQGSQLAFAIVMTPSVMAGNMQIIMSDITYTVNYNSKR